MKLNRREFMGTAAGVAGLSLAASPAPALAQAREIDAVFDRAIVIDTLSDERWDDAGFAAWKKSGYTAAFPTVDAEAPRTRELRPGEWWRVEGNFAAAMESLKEWQQRIRQHSDTFIHATKAADVERAKREGKLAIVLGFQRAPVHDDVDNLDKLHAAGTRWIQLTYNARNNLGDGCLERAPGGLSAFGIACVEKMNDLGIIVDASHSSEATTADAITFSRLPVGLTHTVCQAVYTRFSNGVYHPRAKTDGILRALGNKGGVVGIATLGYFVSPRLDATLDHYIDHIDHAVKVAGVDHVGVSTDHPIRGQEASILNREGWERLRRDVFHSYAPKWPPWIAELDKPDRFRTAAHALARRGYQTGDIEKILGGNWMRLMREVFRG